MATNYRLQFTINESIIWDLNIGNIVRDYKGFSTLSGRYFPTTACWVDFLKHNKHFITIKDECGAYHDVDKIIQWIEHPEKDSSKGQIDYLRSNVNPFIDTKVENGPIPKRYELDDSHDWIDEKSGQLFSSANFC